jgi:hypothetical protein
MLEVAARGLVALPEFSTDAGLLLHPTKAIATASPAKAMHNFSEMFALVFIGCLLCWEIRPPHPVHLKGITLEKQTSKGLWPWELAVILKEGWAARNRY